MQVALDPSVFATTVRAKCLLGVGLCGSVSTLIPFISFLSGMSANEISLERHGYEHWSFRDLAIEWEQWE
jgi:hypothetical protein